MHCNSFWVVHCLRIFNNQIGLIIILDVRQLNRHTTSQEQVLVKLKIMEPYQTQEWIVKRTGIVVGIRSPSINPTEWSKNVSIQYSYAHHASSLPLPPLGQSVLHVLSPSMLNV